MFSRFAGKGIRVIRSWRVKPRYTRSALCASALAVIRRFDRCCKRCTLSYQQVLFLPSEKAKVLCSLPLPFPGSPDPRQRSRQGPRRRPSSLPSSLPRLAGCLPDCLAALPLGVGEPRASSSRGMLRITSHSRVPFDAEGIHRKYIIHLTLFDENASRERKKQIIIFLLLLFIPTSKIVKL